MDVILQAAYDDYQALIKAQGSSPAQAFHTLSGYLRPLVLSRLKARLKREAARHGASLPPDEAT